MKNSYKSKSNEKETEIFLIGMCKGLDKTKDIHQELGTKVLQYQSDDRENSGYFWEKS